MAVVKNLMVRAGADFSGLKTGMDKATKDIHVFKGNMGIAMKGISGAIAGVGTALAALGIGSVVKDAVKSAMDVEASMGMINRTMGNSASAFTDWANKSAIAFNMGKSDALKYGAVYSNLISGFTKDTATTTKYTEDLLKASAVVAAGTGRTMDDVMERIRSGMLGNTESIEDLGINVNVAMIESTKAFQKFAGGKSWDQLSFQVQQQIRLFAILEQSTTKYGDAVANNTNSKQQQFVAQLKNIQLSLGQAFLPIYNAVLPALTRLMEGLARGMEVFAQFTQALFGKADVAAQTDAQAKAVDGLGDAYTAAGKAAMGAVAGFDEVNTLSSGAGSAGSGSAPTVPTPSKNPATKGETDTISQQVKDMAARVKEAFAELTKITDADKARIKESVNGLGESLSKFSDAIKDLGNSIKNSPSIQKWFEDFKSDKANQIASLMDAIAGGFKAWSGTLTMISGIIEGDWKKAWEGLKTNLSGTWEAIKGIFGLMFPDLSKRIGEWKDSIILKWDELKTDTAAKWDAFKEVLSKSWDAIRTGIAWEAVVDIITAHWDDLKTRTGEKWDAFKTYLSEKWNAVKEYTHWDEIKYLITKSWEDLKTETGTKWDDFKTYLSEKWTAVKEFIHWGAIKDAIIAKWDDLKTETGTKWDNLKGTISEKWGAITSMDFSGVKTAMITMWNDLKTETDKIWGKIGEGIKSTINIIIDSLNSMIRGLNQIHIDIPEWVPGLGGKSFGIHINEIQHLAKGGITNGPMMAMIGDNPGGQEVVSPLDGLLDMIQSAVGTAVMAAAQFGGNNRQSDVVINLDGIQLARVLSPYTQKENSRIGAPMISSAGSAVIQTT